MRYRLATTTAFGPAVAAMLLASIALLSISASRAKCFQPDALGVEKTTFRTGFLSGLDKQERQRYMPTLQKCRQDDDDEDSCWVPMNIRWLDVNTNDTMAYYDERLEQEVEVICGNYKEPESQLF